MSTLYLQVGADNLVGTVGNDSFVMTTHSLNLGDSFDGKDGNDEIVLSVNAGYRFSLTLFEFQKVNISGIEDLRFDFSSWGYSSSSSVEAYFNSSQFSNGISSSFHVTGSYYVEHITVIMDSAGTFSAADWSFSNWLNGTAIASYDDLLILRGSNEADRLMGSSGFDHIFGYDGNDVLDAGGGNNQIYGGNGNDIIVGHANGDLIVSGKPPPHFQIVRVW